MENLMETMERMELEETALAEPDLSKDDVFKRLEEQMLMELQRRGLEPTVKDVPYSYGLRRCIVMEKTGESDGMKLAVSIPVERIVERVKKGVPMEELADSFLDATRENPAVGMDVTPDRQTLLNNVRPVLMQYLPQGAIFRKWNDFYVVLKAIVYGITCTGLMYVTLEHLEHTGLTKEELFDAAYSNIENSVCISGLEKLVPFLSCTDEGDLEISVLSSDNSIFPEGASAVLCSSALKKLSRKYGGDFLLLPSSRHEFLALSIKYGLSPQKWKNLVREVNDTLPKEDVLCESVYQYFAEDGEVRMIA